MRCSPCIGLLGSIVAWGAMAGIAGAVEGMFPEQSSEVSLHARALEEVADWELTTSWATEADRIYVLERRGADGEWTARSERFIGDGKPVDFLDQAVGADFPIDYRSRSWRESDGRDERISPLTAGFDGDAATGAVIGRVGFLAEPGHVYQLDLSVDLENWAERVRVSEDVSAEIIVEDPEFAREAWFHYRIRDYLVQRINAGEGRGSRVESVAASDGRVVAPVWSDTKRTKLETLREGAETRGTLRSPHRVVRSIAFEVAEKSVPAGANYVFIDLGLPEGTEPVGINDNAELLFAGAPEEDGQRDMIVWIAGESYNFSDFTGVRFHRVLDIDNSRAVVGSVLEGEVEEVLGFRFAPVKDGPPTLVPLSVEELRNFRFRRMIPRFEGEVTIAGDRYRPSADRRQLLPVGKKSDEP